MKYKICSYLLQDGRWGPAISSPPSTSGDIASFSEPMQFGIYFATKDEADRYAIDFLKDKGISDEYVEVQS